MAAPSARSPLSQSHQSAESSDDSGSENEAPTSKLAALALVEEVEIDVESLNPLSPEVICKQATINIGKSGRAGGREEEQEGGSCVRGAAGKRAPGSKGARPGGSGTAGGAVESLQGRVEAWRRLGRTFACATRSRRSGKLLSRRRRAGWRNAAGVQWS